MERLNVIEKACKFTPDRGRVVVVIECSETSQFAQAITELGEIGARNLALSYAAANGIAWPCINGNVGHPYAVNSEGYSLENVKDENGDPLPPQNPRMQPARYRIDIPVTRRGG